MNAWPRKNLPRLIPGLPASYALQNGRWKTKNPSFRVPPAFDMNRDSIGFKKRVGNDLEFLAIKPNPPRPLISEMLDPGTYISN